MYFIIMNTCGCTHLLGYFECIYVNIFKGKFSCVKVSKVPMKHKFYQTFVH